VRMLCCEARIRCIVVFVASQFERDIDPLMVETTNTDCANETGQGFQLEDT